jgi:cytosine/uracil/thiamine/allantoin permease
MIGVSTTLIGLVKVAKAHISPSRVDQYAGLVGLLFLLSAVVSYVSIRVIDRPDLSQRCERIADQLFICGLVGITVIALLFAFEVI